MSNASPSADLQRPAVPRRRLTRKRYSCRLPLDLASQLEALCEAYPDKKRTRILEDLLRLGLAELERAWTGATASAPVFQPDTRQPIYLLTEPFAEFHRLVHKHHLALEHELAKDEPQASSPLDAYVLGAME